MEIVFIIAGVFNLFLCSISPNSLGSAKNSAQAMETGDQELSVSLIISVYNEESVIRAKIENALELDYPPELLEIIVSSDGSTDGTHDIVEQFKDPRCFEIL
jgi:cellulose synthase/poly-beta-1,6-N-acetylglucosamine synthase-like glycosyltransferase